MIDSFYSAVREFDDTYGDKPEAIHENYALFIARVDKVLFAATGGDYKDYIYNINKSGLTDEMHVLMDDFYKLLLGNKSNGFCSYLAIINSEQTYEDKYSKKQLLLTEEVDFKIGTYNLIRECEPELLVKFIKLLYSHV